MSHSFEPNITKCETKAKDENLPVRIGEDFRLFISKNSNVFQVSIYLLIIVECSLVVTRIVLMSKSRLTLILRGYHELEQHIMSYLYINHLSNQLTMFIRLWEQNFYGQ